MVGHGGEWELGSEDEERVWDGMKGLPYKSGMLPSSCVFNHDGVSRLRYGDSGNVGGYMVYNVELTRTRSHTTTWDSNCVWLHHLLGITVQS